MGQPHNVQLSPAFARKQEVPMLYSQPMNQVHPSAGSLYTTIPQAMVASYPPVNIFPPVANYAYNEEVYASAHQPYPSQRAQPTYYSPNAKARSGY